MLDARKLTSLALLTSAVALSLAACATPPNPALEQARSSYNAAAGNPQVVQNASTELRSAKSLLDKANASFANGDDEDEVAHRAYLAAQQVQVARETAVANDAALQFHAAQAQQSQAVADLADLKAHQTPQGLVLTLGNLLFKTGQAELTPGAQGPIDELASFLRQHPDRSVQIQGYTDSTGSETYNMELSRERADVVRTALVARGVSSSRVDALGFGPASPVADNATPEGRQMNRRVEVVVANTPSRASSGGSVPPPASASVAPPPAPASGPLVPAIIVPAP